MYLIEEYMVEQLWKSTIAIILHDFINCSVPENIHTPPTEGIGISLGVGRFCKAKKFKRNA